MFTNKMLSENPEKENKERHKSIQILRRTHCVTVGSEAYFVIDKHTLDTHFRALIHVSHH